MRKSSWLLLLPLLLLSGCSLAGFAYDLLPRLAVRQADSYLQLSKRQEARALELFRERHALHARDELPRYYALLRKAERAASDGITREEIDAVLDEVEFLYKLAIERTLPAVAEILAGLDDAQLDLLEKRLRADAEKDRKRLDEDHRARRMEKTLEEIEEWTGKLEEPQRAMIIAALEEMHETRPMFLEWRIDNSERFIEFMRRRPKPVEIEKMLAGYWLERANMPEELYAKLQDNANRYREMLIALDGNATEAQRRHALEKLSSFADIVLDIMPRETRAAIIEDREGTGKARE